MEHDKVREILRAEFGDVPSLRALYLQAEVRDVLVCRVFAAAHNTDLPLEVIEHHAFAAFQRAVDRLALETPTRVVFVWYGLTTAPHGEELVLC